MGGESFVTRCPACGTQYTARSWYQLEPLIGRCGTVERRVCAVPGCCHPLVRTRAVVLALVVVRNAARAANDTA